MPGARLSVPLLDGLEPERDAGRSPDRQAEARRSGEWPTRWHDAGVPDVDGDHSAMSDGVRIGTSRILTLGPDGTATSGTLYVRGRRGQFAVRILGATGRTRVLRFDPASGQWKVP